MVVSSGVCAGMVVALLLVPSNSACVARWRSFRSAPLVTALHIQICPVVGALLHTQYTLRTWSEVDGEDADGIATAMVEVSERE